MLEATAQSVSKVVSLLLLSVVLISRQVQAAHASERRGCSSVSDLALSVTHTPMDEGKFKDCLGVWRSDTVV